MAAFDITNFKLVRPFTYVESPFTICQMCQYIGGDMGLGTSCPKCGQHHTASYPWPSLANLELWKEAIFCWDHQKAELGAIVAAMYFEAHTWELLYWATVWLHPTLNWIGVDVLDVEQKEHAIHQHLNSLNSRQLVNEALEDVFKAPPKEMLETVLGSGQAKSFWDHYMRLCKHRNSILHRGLRIEYAQDVLPEDAQRQQKASRDRFLVPNLNFIPLCWGVFAKLWNHYIHETMLAKKAK